MKTAKGAIRQAQDMSTTRRFTCVFRRPKFPLICSIDGYFVAARSLQALGRNLIRFDLAARRELDLIDANGETWMLLLDEMVLAPGFFVRKWRKADIIRLFNESRNAKERGLRYPESVIPNRRLDAIINDLAALLARSPGGAKANGGKELHRGR
jgi:hypothetical protein